MPYLRVEQKQEKPFEIDLTSRKSITIGRSSSNDLVFNHLSLSRYHAKIIAQEGKFVVEDCGSRNGTFLNGVRLRQPTSLKHGDMIQLGDVTIRFIEPLSEKVEVTDASPVAMEGTLIIDTDELTVHRYVQKAISGRETVQTTGLENIWPALNQAAATLITHYPLDKLVEVVMDIVFQAVSPQRGALILRNPDDPEKMELKVIRSTMGNQNLQISRTIIHEVMKNQKAILTMDAQSDQRFEAAQSIQMQGIRSIICVPLWNDQAVTGFIYLDNLIANRTFTQSDLRLVALIANMAAVKIENSRLLEDQIEKKRMEEQLAVAAQIQRRLLPQTCPQLPGYDIYGVNQSCYAIGGDYYDFLRKDNGRLGIVIADVAGKGIGAALLMASFHASIRSLVKTDMDPAALMHQLNNVMLENSPPNKYITAFYGELDPETHVFRYVNAGHNPPILCSNRHHQLLPACGPVLGILRDAKYTYREITLPPRCLLFLYTDGISEAQNPEGEEFGQDLLAAFLAKNIQINVEDLAALLVQRIKDFTRNAPAADDATLILIKRTES